MPDPCLGFLWREQGWEGVILKDGDPLGNEVVRDDSDYLDSDHEANKRVPEAPT